MAPQILVEPFMSMDKSVPTDYKFYVFHGEPKYIQVDTDRECGHRMVFFDAKWSKAPFVISYPNESRPVARPKSLEQMLDAAARLGRDFSFVRVDFYEIDGKPYIGELTFFPGSGGGKFIPSEYDEILGSHWKLEK